MSDVTPEMGAELPEVHDVDSAADYIFQKRQSTETESEIDEVEQDLEVVDDVETELEELDEVETVDNEDTAEAGDDQTGDVELELSSVNELAEVLEVPLEDLSNNLKVTVKVNGQESEVTLSEAVKGYQREADYTKKTEEHSAKVRAFEAESQEQSKQTTENLNQALYMANAFEQELSDLYNKTDWSQYDDVQTIKARQEFQDRHNQIQGLKQNAIAQLTQQQQQATQEADKKSHATLSQLIPSWSDESFNKAKEFMQGYGFTAEELKDAPILDHRYIHIIHDAMQATGKVKSLDEKVIKTKKKVKQTPSLKSSPLRNNKVKAKANQLNALKKKMKSSNSSDDIAAYLLAKRKT